MMLYPYQLSWDSDEGGSDQEGSDQGGSDQWGRDQVGSDQGGSVQGGSDQGGRNQRAVVNEVCIASSLLLPKRTITLIATLCVRLRHTQAPRLQFTLRLWRNNEEGKKARNLQNKLVSVIIANATSINICQCQQKACSLVVM